MAYTNKPWDGSASRWPTAEAYCAASMVDNNTGGQPKSKSECHFPYKEPNGDINVNALRAIVGGRGAQADFPGAAAARERARAMLARAPSSRSQAERRSVALVDLDAAGDGSTFSGYAAVFDEEADLGGFTESVARGAFRKVLAEMRNVPMLWNHNPDKPLATTEAGTLTLNEDMKGLRVTATLGNTSWANDLRDMLDRGEVRGMSYGFVAGPGNSKIEHRADRPHRTLLGFTRLIDVSPTWDPAYATTEAELRGMTAIAIDLQQLLEGDEDPQLEDGAAPIEDPDEIAEARTSGSDEEPTRAPGLAAAKRRLRLIDLYEKEKGESL